MTSRHCESHGLPCDAEAHASVEIFERYRRSWPAGLDLEEPIQRAAAWSVARLGVSPAELIAKAAGWRGSVTRSVPRREVERRLDRLFGRLERLGDSGQQPPFEFWLREGTGFVRPGDECLSAGGVVAP